MESFATGLKRIYTACNKAGCRVEFEQQAYGFAVVFYRREKDNMGGKPQDAPQDTPQDTKNVEVTEQILLFCKEAKSKKEIMDFMSKEGISFCPVNGDKEGYNKIIDDIINKLNKETKKK